MKPANFAPVYCALYPGLAEICRTRGYALAIHGSLGRDMDLICVPWADSPVLPSVVVNDIVTTFAIRKIGEPVLKSHNRLVYTLSIGHGECAIDLSFTPFSGAP